MRPSCRILLAGLVSAPVACAAAGPYVSAAGGYSWSQDTRLESSHAGVLESPLASDLSEGHGAWNATLGYDVLPRVAVEASWRDYGRQTLTASGASAAGDAAQLSTRREVSAAALDMVGRWPVRDAIALVGRVGIAFARVKASSDLQSVPGGGTGSDATARSWAFHVAGGADFALGAGWDVEATLEYLGPVGTKFEAGDLGRTGRSSQATAWLALVKRF